MSNNYLYLLLVVLIAGNQIFKGNIVLSCDMNSTASNNYKLTARKVVKHSNHKMRRDREPSRF